MWFTAPMGGAEGTLEVMLAAGGPGSPQSEVTVVVTLTNGKPPVVGSTFAVVRRGRTVGHGKVTGVRADGKFDGVAWPEAGERPGTGDEVRMDR